MPLRRRQALLAITVGGLVAGTLDLAPACMFFGPKVPLVVAGGILGSRLLGAAQPSISWESACTSYLLAQPPRSITEQVADCTFWLSTHWYADYTLASQLI